MVAIRGSSDILKVAREVWGGGISGKKTVVLKDRAYFVAPRHPPEGSRPDRGQEIHRDPGV